MAEPYFPRDIPLFEQNQAILKVFWDLFLADDGIHCLWTLAMNQVAARYEETRLPDPIGSTDPIRQKGVEFLWNRLKTNPQAPRPMELLLDRLRGKVPELAHLAGKHLPAMIEEIMLRFLYIRRTGRPPSMPFQWQGEYITVDNPIRVVEHTSKEIIFALPLDVTPKDRAKYLLQLDAYLNAFRPVNPPGRPPKPPDAPRTTRRTTSDDEARRAWDLHQHSEDRVAIAQALFSYSPTWPEQERRRVFAKVDRRIARGRRLANPLPQR
jgi:hypothetical protein